MRRGRGRGEKGEEENEKRGEGRGVRGCSDNTGTLQKLFCVFMGPLTCIIHL